MRVRLERWAAVVALTVAVTAASGVAQANPQVTSNLFGASGPQPVVLSTGETFDVSTLDLALGPLNPVGPQDIAVTATFADSSTSDVDLKVGLWKTFDLNLTGLTSLAFAVPYYGGGDYGYLAFDNIHYQNAGGPKSVVDFEDQTEGSFVFTDLKSGGADFNFYWGVIYGPDSPLDFPTGVPEPGMWALVIAGFTLCGAMLRRARRLALSEA
jgi:hypothetical protein